MFGCIESNRTPPKFQARDIIVVGVVALFVRSNPTLAILGILFGGCLLGRGLLIGCARNQQIEFEKSEQATNDDPRPF
ncbi:hypothetical protein AS189_18840 [Arthrobacter alpinus]|uniref:DUF2892 domain-containing protein n=1 Tax=Arthrobacter alpinus TaxID=656366 RepID=A0A0S2M398_9MICC|nr:hypothetical protein AS189_18840 [Arthrobacter alpinus]